MWEIRICILFQIIILVLTRETFNEHMKTPELKLSFTYAKSMFKYFRQISAFSRKEVIDYCKTEHGMKIAFLSTTKAEREVSKILKGNQVLGEITVGGYLSGTFSSKLTTVLHKQRVYTSLGTKPSNEYLLLPAQCILDPISIEIDAFTSR